MPDYKDQIIENLQKEVEELKRIVEMQNDIIRDLRTTPQEFQQQLKTSVI